MFGIIVVTHGRLAQELVSATEHVVGPLERVRAIGVEADDDLEQRRRDLEAALKDVEGTEGAVIIADMFGGTPANLAVSLLDKGRVEVVAGANLPMLIKLAEARESLGASAAAEAAREAGRRYIAIAGGSGDGK